MLNNVSRQSLFVSKSPLALLAAALGLLAGSVPAAQAHANSQSA